MTREEFDSLKIGDEIELEEETVRVLDIDRMGRVQLCKMQYHIDLFEYSDKYFDYEEDAYEYLDHQMQMVKDDIENYVDSDEEEKTFDELEEELDELKYADIEAEETGEPYWMHYKDI